MKCQNKLWVKKFVYLLLDIKNVSMHFVYLHVIGIGYITIILIHICNICKQCTYYQYMKLTISKR